VPLLVLRQLGFARLNPNSCHFFGASAGPDACCLFVLLYTGLGQLTVARDRRVFKSADDDRRAKALSGFTALVCSLHSFPFC